MFCDLAVFVALNEVGKVSFHLIDTNGFFVKVENERFAAAGSRCHENLKHDNFTCSGVPLCKTTQPSAILLLCRSSLPRVLRQGGG